MLNQKETYAIKHIIEYCNKLEEIKQRVNNSFDEFKEDDIIQLSAGMCIIQIGELSTHLTDKTKNELSSIPWKSIKDMRNIFAHRYGTIDSFETWKTMVYKIPTLQNACLSAINDNILYAEVSQEQLNALKKEKVPVTFKKRNDRIIIRFYKYNEEKIKSVIASKPPSLKK